MSKEGYKPTVGEEYAAYQHMSGGQVDATHERERVMQDPEAALLRYARELRGKLKYDDECGGEFVRMVQDVMVDLAHQVQPLKALGYSMLIDHKPEKWGHFRAFLSKDEEQMPLCDILFEGYSLAYDRNRNLFKEWRAEIGAKVKDRITSKG